MGFFFLAISFTIALSLDIDGCPDSLLISHLQDNIKAHSSPLFLTYVGTFLLAIGYGMDLNERIGCPAFPFGVAAATCFPIIVLGFGQYLRRRRRLLVKKSGSKTGENEWNLGVNFFLPWVDLMVKVNESEVMVEMTEMEEMTEMQRRESYEKVRKSDDDTDLASRKCI